MVALWITMAGQAGAGKSTLADSLGRELRRRGHRVDVFGEEQLFTRTEFVAVAKGFRARNHPGPGSFEGAYGAWLAGLSTDEIAIMDWSPAGMAGDLRWGLSARSTYVRHLRAVRALGSGRVILIQVLVPVGVAVGRAAEQRGEEWLARYDQLARAGGSRQPDRLDRIREWAGVHDSGTAAEVEAAAEAGWPVHRIDGDRAPQEVLDQALAAVDAALAR